jgi:hypothetical protein
LPVMVTVPPVVSGFQAPVRFSELSTTKSVP